MHTSKTIAADKPRKQNDSSTVSESFTFLTKKHLSKSIQPKATVESFSTNAQCFSGNNFSFTSSSTISTGSIATEFWDFGDGKTASGTTVSHSYFLPGTYSVKLIVTSDKGCVDSLSRSVTVYPQPQASFIIPSGQCLTGNNFNFISNATIGFGGSISSQSWNFGDGNVATGNNSSHSFSLDGKYPVNLQVTSTDGCTDIITDTITVFQMPLVSASVVSPVCSGTTINLNTAVSGGTAPYQYVWTGPNSFNATQANPTISNASTNASGNYSVILSDSNGCSASATASLVVNLTPIVAPISGPPGGCVGSSINLSNTTANGIWSSQNNAIATINASSGQVSFISTGSVIMNYSVTNASCTTIVSSNLYSNSVSLHPDIIECNNGITHFNATDPYYGVTYSNNNVGNTYLWTITGGPYSYQGSSSAASKYVDLQLQTGNAFTIRVQFTSNSVSCIAQQMVYKNTSSADSIQGSHDTTVCNSITSIPLSGVVSAATNAFQWTSSGTGSFTNTVALHTNYTPSAADKIAGIVKIYFTATSNLNSTGNCGSSYGKDSMVLRIYPANMSTNANQVICSNQNINFSPISSIPGSFYSWSSSVVAGSANGNSATGTGNINDSLVNNSNSLDAQVVYNITPFAFTPTNITCIGNPFNYTVLIKPNPKSTITNNTTSICTGTNTNIQFNSSIIGSTYTWSSTVMNGGAMGNSTNNIASTNNTIQDQLTNGYHVNSNVRYYIHSVSSSGCNNIDSTDVLVFALPTTANAGPDQTLCNVTSTVLSANIPGIGAGKWDMLSGPSAVNFGTPTSPFSTVTGLVPGTYQFIWSITNGSCIVSKDTIQLINAAVSIGGIINSNTTVCTGQNSGTLTLTGYSGSIKSWESSMDGGITWPLTINDTTNTYTFNNLTGTTLFRANIQSGNCSVVNATPATVIVNNNSNPGILVSDTSVCINSNSGMLYLTNNNGSILHWESSIDNGISWQNINNNSNTLSFTNLNSTTRYRALTQNGACNNVYSNSVLVKVNPNSIAGLLGANAIVCSNNNNGSLTLAGNTGKIIAWETSIDNGNSWTSISDSSNSFSYSNLTTTTNYRTSIQSGNCPAVFSNITTVSVLQNVSVSNAGTDQALCDQSTATLAANTPTSGTGSWSAIASNPAVVSFSNTNDPASIVSGLIAGTYQFVWTISNTLCADSKDTVQIVVNSPTIAGVLSADAIVCANNNTQTLTLTGTTGAILSWESSINNGGTWTMISNNTNAYTFNNLSSSTTFRALVKNQICPSVYSNIVTITVLQAATIANAGTDQTICNQTTTTLDANTAISGTGTWSALSNNPSTVNFTNNNDPHTTVTGLKAGTYQFVWTISNTLCADSKDTVQIIVNPPTNPGVLNSDATVCANSNNGTLSLNGYLDTIQHWESSINGINWTTITNTTNTLNYTNLSNSTFYRVSVINGNCPSLFSNTVRINVLPAASIADAGPDTTLINGFSSYRLQGNVPSSGTGVWTVIPPAGPSNLIFTDTFDANATIHPLTFHYADSTTIPVTPPSDGIYYLKWTISNGICPASESIMVVTVQPPTNPGFVGQDTVICAGVNQGIVNLKGYFGDILQWEDSTANSSGWQIIPRTIGTDQDTIHFENLTTTTMYRALVKNGVGLSLYSGIAATITVLDAVTIADAGADSSICNTSVVQLWGNNPTVGTGTWTYIPNGSALSVPSFSNKKDPKTIVTGLSQGTYQFVWTISNGSCNNSTDTVSITINAPTESGSLFTSNVVCANNNYGVLHLSGYKGSVLQSSYSIDNGMNWLNISNSSNKDSIIYNNLSLSTQYRVEVKNGECPSLFSNIVSVTVLSNVSIANAGLDQSICNQSSTILSAKVPNAGTGKWTAVSGNPSIANFTNANDPNTTVSGLLAGNYQFEWTVSNNLCADSKDTVQVFVHPQTIAGTLSADAIVCSNNNTNTLTLTGYTGSVLAWEYSINSGSTWVTIANTDSTYSYKNLDIPTSFRTLVQNNICTSAYSNIVHIAVLQNATIANAGTDQILCNQSSSILHANTPTTGTGYWAALATNTSTIVFTNTSDPNTTISGLIAGTYQFVWTISNSNCADSKDTVQVTVFDAVKAGSLIADNFVCANANSGDLTLLNFVRSIVQWESSNDNGVNWNIIPNTNNAYHYSNLSTSTLFRVLVANGPCNSVYSNLVSITVNPLTQPGILTTNDSIVCESYNHGKLSLNGNTGTIIHWEYSEDNGANWIILNESNNTYDFNNIHTPTLFRVLIQSGVCNNSYSNTIQISTSAATIAGTISGNATICYSNNSGSLTLTGNTGNILHWEFSNDNGISWGILADTNRIINYNLLTTTTIYRALVQNAVCSFEYTNSVKIDVVAPVTIANAGPDQVICNAASSTILKANQAISGEGVWTMVSGGSDIYFDDATAATTKVNGLLPGSYQFNWKIDNGICASSSSFVTIIVDKPKADFSLTAINDCGSTTYQFVDASTSIFGIANWKWSAASGDTATNIKNYRKTYTQPGQNKISLTVQSNTGCINTTGANYQVKVFSIPKANINAINEACKNELLQLTSTLTSRDSINAILWNLGNGVNIKDSITTVQYFSEGKYTIKLLVSTVNKCYDSTIKDIAIHPLPIVSIPADQIACKGDTLKLAATGAMNYIWKDQQNNIVCNGCAVYSYLPTANNSFSVIGYNQYGCSQIANTNVKLIQPIKIATKLLDTLCQGTSIKLKVTGADTYTWLPDAGLNNYKIANPVASPLVTTTYTVIGKENYACFADTAKIRLVVGTPTTFTIGADTTIQSGVPFKLFATSNEIQNIRGWQWYGNADFACPNCASTMAKVVFDGNIHLTATNIYGCMSTDTITIKTFCPNSEIFIPNAFTPDGDGINDILFVQGSGIKLIKSFKIYSRWGELVFERTNFQPGDKSNGWDGKVRGKPASQDVFVYICEAICEKGIPATFKGNIALLK